MVNLTPNNNSLKLHTNLTITLAAVTEEQRKNTSIIRTINWVLILINKSNTT